MKALGMIEVYGYTAAVEALDSALKAANVEAVEVAKVQGGLVSVFISGDVGATRAAVDAASVAASRVGKVISTHVIPRPAEDTKRLFEEKRGNGAPPDDEPAAATPEVQESPSGESALPEEPSQEEPEKDAESADDAENAEGTEDAVEDSDLAGMTDSLSGLTEDTMRGMTVAVLRSAARALDLSGMTKQDIRFAKKEELIRAISAFLEKGR